MSDNERLAIVETELKNVKDVVTRIERKLDSQGLVYAAKDALGEVANRVQLLENKRLIRDILVPIGFVVSSLIAIISLYQLFAQ